MLAMDIKPMDPLQQLLIKTLLKLVNPYVLIQETKQALLDMDLMLI